MKMKAVVAVAEVADDQLQQQAVLPRDQLSTSTEDHFDVAAELDLQEWWKCEKKMKSGARKKEETIRDQLISFFLMLAP